MLDLVIIGGLHHNTLGVLRSFGERKMSKSSITVFLVGEHVKEKNIISKSKYVSRKNIKYLKQDSNIVENLIDLAKDEKKRVIVCCSDGSAEQVMGAFDLLKTWYEMPSAVENVSLLMEKQYQSEIAVKSGLRIPKSAILTGEDIDNWNIFPCITKPAKSIMGGGKADIHISHSKKELLNFINETKAESVQVQEFIQKSMEFQLIGCSLNAGETVIIPGYTDIIRQPENTNTGYLLYSPIKQLSFDFEAATRFIKNIGYSGLFSLEFIRDKEGNDYFLEINMRNDGNAYCVKTAGVNLPYIWYSYCQTRQVPENEKTSFENSVYFMPDFNDIKRGITTVGFWKWTWQFFKAKSHSVFNYRDMRPFLFQFKQFLLSHIFKK